MPLFFVEIKGKARKRFVPCVKSEKGMRAGLSWDTVVSCVNIRSVRP